MRGCEAADLTCKFRLLVHFVPRLVGAHEFYIY